MNNLPYTIKIFVPDGDPKGLRIIDKMNWTGAGLVFPREPVAMYNNREELNKAGVYVLVGAAEEENDPRQVVYIGQTDNLKSRFYSHLKEKDFWDWACVFVSSNNGLNRAHITWIEHELIKMAHNCNQAIITNGTMPQEPTLSESEKGDTRAFLHEILQIMPLIGLTAFEQPRVFKNIEIPVIKEHNIAINASDDIDTIVVPAKEDGFAEVFLGEHCWYAIRIGGGNISKLKYIAAYRSQPISAITHYAKIDSIIPYGDSGKYKVVFSEKAIPIEHIKFGGATSGAMQSPRYTRFEKLEKAETLVDLF